MRSNYFYSALTFLCYNFKSIFNFGLKFVYSILDMFTKYMKLEKSIFSISQTTISIKVVYKEQQSYKKLSFHLVLFPFSVKGRLCYVHQKLKVDRNSIQINSGAGKIPLHVAPSTHRPFRGDIVDMI